MRKIAAGKIRDTVEGLVLSANFFLRADVLTQLKKAYAKETNKKAKNILEAVIRNARIAKEERLAICQDTGLPCVFAEIGNKVTIDGDLLAAIEKGIESGYRKGYLRPSIVRDPLLRNKSGYRGVVAHTDIVKGNKLKLTVLPKGFGCENKTQLKMFRPTAETSEIKKFILDAVRLAGPDACPPYIVGVGIGGTADYACLLAKKALLRKLRSPRTRLETELLKAINKLNIGPMGLGGKATALAVNIENFPTHIAGLPVCVNISCHALRSASKII